MGDQVTVGPNAGGMAAASSDRGAERRDPEVVATVAVAAAAAASASAVEQSMGLIGGNGGSNGGGGGGGGDETVNGGDAKNIGGHPVPDNLNIIANGMTKANGAGRGGNGDNGEGDNLAGDDVGITDEDGGRAPIDTACSDGGPSSLVGMVGPPSPLTGCYLLIVLGEPHSEEHKDHILQNLLKGFLSWDVSDCHVDLEDELNTITQHAPEGEEARHGERLIQYASENLVTEVLIHPQYNTLIQCMRNLLSSFTRHRHVIHAGYTFSGNGSWILQDGTFSVADFSEAFQEHDVQRVLRAYPDTITMNIHCADNGLWNTLPDKTFARLCKIRINPTDVLDTSNESINAFIDYLAPMLAPASLNELLETSDVVGNIRFTHPTLYVFPGGQGDAALFGINGFNMLVDGGFNRKACFWDFARHLDRLDAVLLTRLNNSNINGMSAVVERKRESHVYPHIGHFFCNIPDHRSLPSPDGDKDKDPLLVDLFERGHTLVSDLKSLDLKPQTCYRNSEPINLYHKVGHGTLDMYVISPSKDSKEVKEFLQKWNAGDQRLFAARDTREFNFPLQNMVSICALLVWQPADPDDTITRILFPGSTPDYKIQEGLDKLKHLEFMKYSTCTAKSIAPVIQTVTTRRVFKSGPLEKGIVEPVLPSKVGKQLQSERDASVIETRMKTTTVQQQQDNKIKETTVETIEKKIEKVFDKDDEVPTTEVIEQVPQESEQELESKEEEKQHEKDNKQITEKKVEVMIVKPQQQQTEPPTKDETPDIIKAKHKAKAEKPRAEVKPVIRSRIDTKPPKSMDKKGLKKEDRKASPPPVSRKQEIPTKPQPVKEAKEKETKPRAISRVPRTTLSSTPAKSAKDANNRKVLESKQHTSKATTTRREVSRTSAVTEKKESKKTERKPISRRPRGTSPSKRAPGSPVKVPKPRTELKKSRLDKGGTTDSSLVSTPSADDVPSTKKIQDMVISQELDAAKQRELDDLKEEQEVVREIEAVFSRDEKKRLGELKADHREIAKQDSTTEAEEDEEYLIIEKEEIEQYTEDSIIEQESSITKEEEIQKHQRDSQESEKKRKKSAEEEIEAEIAKAEAEERRNRQQTEPEEDDEEEGEEDGDMQPDSIEEKAKLTSPEKSELKAEVQEIISSAKEIVKARTEEAAVKTEELSSPTPEEKISSAKKTSDTKDEPVEEQDAGKYANLQESLPEEKFSATIESGATTAPTLPEDERIPLDEIKEDLVIEEKHVKEDTKEVETSPPQPKTATTVEAPTTATERVLPLKMTFETQQNLMRDVVKTPDEVADLPMHEEADFGVYDEKETQDTSKPLSLKEEIAKEEKEVEEEKDVTKEQKEIEIKDTKEPPKTETAKEVVDKKEKVVKEEEESKTQVHLEKVKAVEKEIKETIKVTEKPDAVTEKIVPTEPTTMSKKSITSPDDKEVSDITSEDELPEQLPPIRGKVTELKDKEDTVSLESPATIEEAIEVEIEKTTLIRKGSEVEKLKDDRVGKSLLEELQIESRKTEIGTIKPLTDAFTKTKIPQPVEVFRTETVSSRVNVAIIGKELKPSIAEISTVDTKTLLKGEEDDKTATKKENVGLESSDMVSPPASKEESQPESVASHVDEEYKDRKLSVAESIKADGKKPQQDEEKAEPTAADKVSPVASQKDEKTPPPSMEASRPESVASHVDEEEKDRKLSVIESIKADEKKPETDKSMPEAALADKVSPVASQKDEKSPPASKEASRPESVASHVDEEEKDRKLSIAESIKTDKKTPEKDEPKPEPEVADKVSPVASQKDEKSPPASKEASRPDSVASHVDEEEKDRKLSITESIKADEKTPEKDESKLEPAVGDKVSPVASQKDEKSPPASKEPSRPESVASHVDKEEKDRKLSVAESIKADEKKPETDKPKPEAELADKVSPVASQKDEKSPPASKEASRPESVASHVDEEEKDRKLSVADSIKADEKKPETDKPKPEAELADKVSPVASQKDEKSPPASKEASRPESVASHVDEEEKDRKLSIAESIKADEKKPETDKSMPEAALADKVSPVASQKDEKSPPASKEASRPESVASHVDEEEKDGKLSIAESIKADKKTPEKDESKLEPAVGDKVSPVASQKHEKSPPASKEASRPESVASHVDEEEKDRKLSVAESIKADEKTPEKDEPKPEAELADKVSPVASQKDEKSPPASKEASRPESVASHVDEEEKDRKLSVAESIKADEKTPEKDEPKPEAALADKVSPVASQKDEKSPTASKEASRPVSVASHVDEEEKDRKLSIAESIKADKMTPEKDESKLEPAVGDKVSPVASQKHEKSPPASKEASRPESVASHVDEEEKDRKLSVAESIKADEKTPEKDEPKPEAELADKVSPVASQKDEKSPPASKEASRPESVASHVDEEEKDRQLSVAESIKADEKTPEKDEPKPEAALADKVSPVASQKDEKSPPASKEASRPESVASHVDEEEKDRKLSIAESIKADEKKPETDKSMPEAALADKVSPVASQKDEKSPPASKEASRPESVASHVDEEEKDRKLSVAESIKADEKTPEKDEPKPEAALADKVSPVASQKDEKSPPASKEASRPESVASHVDDEEKDRKLSIAESIKADEKKPETDKSMPEAALADKVSPVASQKDEKSPPASKEASRPESVASHVDEEEKDRKLSIAESIKADEKKPETDKSMPEAALADKVSPVASQKDEKSPPASKEASRPESVASHVDEEEKDRKLSVAESIKADEKTPEKDEPKPEGELADKVSPVASQKDEKSPPASKEASRPESVASHVDEEEKDRKLSIAESIKADEKKPETDKSMPEAALADKVSPVASQKDEKSPPASKEASRPESVASHVDEEEKDRKLSVAESIKADEKTPEKDEPKPEAALADKVSPVASQKDEKSRPASKEASRPESVASHVDDEEKDRKLSIAESIKADEKKPETDKPKPEAELADKVSPVASQKDEKSPPASKEASRPESVASHVDEEEKDRKLSVAESIKADEKTPEKIEPKPEAELADKVLPIASQKDEKSPPASKEASRPESVASHVDEEEKDRKLSVADSIKADEKKPETDKSKPEAELADKVSPVASQKDEKSPPASKEASRPESVASHVDEEEKDRKLSIAESIKADERTPGKDESKLEPALGDKVSPVASQKDEKSPPASKETSRPESVASHVDEEEKDRKLSIAENIKADEKIPEKNESKLEPAVGDKVSPVASQKDGKSPPASKEASRPKSVASHVDEGDKDRKLSVAESIKGDEKTPEKDESKPQSVVSEKVSPAPSEKDDKSLPPSKEASRPESVVSHVDEGDKDRKLSVAESIKADEKTPEKDESKPPSVVSEKVSPAPSEKDDKSLPPSKEASRPESVVSHVDEGDKDRKLSVAESIKSDEKTPEKDESKPPSVVSEKVSPAHSEEDNKSLPPSKEASRPESVVSHVDEGDKDRKLSVAESIKADEKTPEKDESKPASVVCEKASPAPSEKGDKSLPPSKEVSRPESVVSHVDEGDKDRKLSVAESIKADEKTPEKDESKPPSVVSEKVSPAPSEKDDKSLPPSKVASRPESVVSHVDEGDKDRKLSVAESIKADEKTPEKDESKPPSVVSEKASPAPSEKDDKSLPPSKEASRPESVVSHVDEGDKDRKLSVAESIKADEKTPEKDESKPPSVVSEKVSPAPSEKDDKSLPPSKEASRPESVVSHVDEGDKDRKLSVAESIKADEKTPEKDESKPPSVVSEKVSPAPSEKDDKSLPPSKEASRPESVASHVDEGDKDRKLSVAESIKADEKTPEKDESKPDSVVSEEASPAPSEKDDKSLPPSKEASRPESVVSHVDEGDKDRKLSVAESIKADEKTPEKDESKPASVVSEKVSPAPSEKDDKSLPPSKEASRPESVLSHVDDGDKDRKLSVAESIKADEKAPEKDELKPASVVSEKVSPAPSEKDDKSLPPSKEASRPESVVSHVDEGDKDRTLSVAESIKADEKTPEKDESKPPSVVSEKVSPAPSEKDDKSLPPSKEASRPESVVSHVDEGDKDRKLSVAESIKADEKTPEKDESKPPSVVSEKVSPAPSEKDDKSLPPSKEASRPESVVSHVDEGDKDRKLSVAESIKADEKTPEKDESKPPSVVSEKVSPAPSEKDDKSLPPSKEASRPESVVSHVDEGDKDRKLSVAESITADKKTPEKDESKPDSVVSEKASPAPSEKDDKSLPPSKEASRPESVVSHVDEGDKDRKLSVAESIKADEKTPEKDESKPPSVVSEKVSPAPSEKDDKSLPPSKEASRPESVLSHVDDGDKDRKLSVAESIKADEKAPEKDELKPASVVSEKASPAPSEKDEKSLSQSKEASRPESVVSHVDEGDGDRKLSVAESIKSDEKTPEKDESKPASVVSEKVSPAPSEKDDKSLPPSKEASRPESVVSHVDDGDKDRKLSVAESIKADEKTPEKDESKPPSVVSEKVSPAPSEKDDKSLPPSKEASRPESVVSHVDEGDKDRKLSVAESITADKKTPEKDESKPDSVVSEKASPAPSEKDDKSLPPSKEASRPESVVSQVDDGDKDRKLSVAESIKADEKTPEKDESKPPSVVSEKVSPAPSEKDDKSLPPSKEASRPESVVSHVDEGDKDRKLSVAESIKADEKTPEKDESKPPSVVSEKVSPAPSEKDDKSLPPSKEASRPESVASHVDEGDKDRKLSVAESIKADEKTPEKHESKPDSVVSEKVSPAPSEKDDKSLPPSKEASRPESVVSHVDDGDKDRKLSVAESIKADEKTPEKDESKPASVVSEKASPVSSEKDEKSLPPSKEASRPESVVSHVDEADKDRKLSVAESIKGDEKTPDKDTPKAESVIRHKEDKPLSSQFTVGEKLSESVVKVAEIESVKVEWQIGSETVSPIATEKKAVVSTPPKDSDSPKELSPELPKSKSAPSPGEKTESPKVESQTESKFPVVLQHESKFPSPQKSKSTDYPLDPAKISPAAKLSPLETSLIDTAIPEKQPESGDTVSSPIDKASPSLTAAEFEQISKPDKESFKLDLQQQAKPEESGVATTSSPVDVAHSEFVGTIPKKIVEESKKSEKTEVMPGEKAKVSTETVSSPIDEVAPSLETDQQLTTGETIGEVVETLKAGISQATVKATEITSSICDDLKQMALKVETIAEDSATTIQKKTIPDAEKIAVVTEEIEETIVSETTEAVKVSYDIKSFHTELRETHITTVDSTARDEIILHDIKEEDEEHRFSPPKETSADKTTIISSVQPQRPVSPREEEVAKIVANVAEVLKSEKDITEIIPDFDEKELEEKLLKTKEEEAATVQRMLVTASSEDGGEEIEICPKGSIVFTPSSTPDVMSGKVSPDGSKDLEAEMKEKEEKQDEKSLKSPPESEKSSPDIKSGPISLEEKDRIEVSEKVQMGKVSHIIADRKESASSLAEYPVELRRESAVSTLSEKDLTRDESTYDERPDSEGSHELGKLSPEPTDQVQEIIRESVQYVTKIETKSSATDGTQISPQKSVVEDHKDSKDTLVSGPAIDELISKTDIYKTVTTTTKTLTSSFIDKERELAEPTFKPTSTTVTSSSVGEKASEADAHKTVVLTTTTVSSAPLKLSTASPKDAQELPKPAEVATGTVIEKVHTQTESVDDKTDDLASKTDIFKTVVVTTKTVTSTIGDKDSTDTLDATSPKPATGSQKDAQESIKTTTQTTAEKIDEALSKTVVVTTKTVTSTISGKDSLDALDATDSQKDTQESTKTATVTGQESIFSGGKADDALSKTVVVTTKTVTSTLLDKDSADDLDATSSKSTADSQKDTQESTKTTTVTGQESIFSGGKADDALSKTVVVTTKTVTSTLLDKDSADDLDATSSKSTADSQKDTQESTKTTTVTGQESIFSGEKVDDALSKTVVVTTKTVTSTLLDKDSADDLDATSSKSTADSQKDDRQSTTTTTVTGRGSMLSGEKVDEALSKTVVVTTKTVTSGFVSKDEQDILDSMPSTSTSTTTQGVTSVTDQVHEKIEEAASKKDTSTTVFVTTKTVTSSYGLEQEEQDFSEKLIEKKESSQIEEIVKIGEKAFGKETTTTTTSLPKQSITEHVSQSHVKKEEVAKSDFFDTQVVSNVIESVTTTTGKESASEKTGTEKSASVSSIKEDLSEVSSSESRSSHTEEILTEKESSVTKLKEQKEETTGTFQESLITQREVSVRDSAVSSTISKATTVKESVIVKSEETKESQASRISSETQQSSTTILRSDSLTKSEVSEKEKSSTSVTSVTSKKLDTSEALEEIQVTDKQTISEQISETTAHSDIKDSRRESTLSQSSEGRQTCSLSDYEDEEDDDADLLKIKEARSKSIATIMMTSIYKPSDESQVLSALDEEEPSEATATTIHELSRPATSTTQSYETVQRTTIAQDSISGKGKRIDTIFSSSLIDDKSPEEHIDRKTPPTAPVSPGIKSTTTSEQRDSVQHTSLTAMQYSEICGTSVPSSPKDFSGKSSPGALTSESRSIPTPAGRESLTETPESSPKPTSPFPRVAKEDIQTTTTFGATEVVRTSTPELCEIRALEKTPLTASHEKIITTTITTVTKVISADGKEIVTEEKTITTTDTSEPDGEKVTVTTTRTTSESDKAPLQPKELAMLRSEYRSSTPGGSDDERPYSDDEIPPSPRSVASSQAASYDLQRSSSGISKRSDLDIDDSQDDIPPQYGSEEHSSALSISMAHKIVDPMSTSFYGALPDSFGPLTTSSSMAEKSEPIPIRTTRTIVSRTFTDSPSQSSESDGTSQSWAIRHGGDHKFLDEADLDFEKALEEHRQVRGAEVMSSVTSKYSYSPSKSTIEETITKPKFPLGDIQKAKSEGGTSAGTADEEKKEQQPEAKPDAKPKDPLKEWGKPLGLPSPAPIPTENDVRTTPKKERRMIAAKTKLNNEKNLRKRSESPSKTKKSSPVYVDLTYVPHNGNSYYSHVEFFKKVRARYYVFSGTEPSREVYNALLEAKQSWEDKDLEVTIIPTYDTDVLGYWVAENEELLAKYHIDLSPSASRCTINLQDHETSCSAYRLEF